MSLLGPIISVEDDEDDQYLIEQTIQQLDIPNKIRFFANGEAALHYLETTTEQPFLILCDVNMPVMNGLEFRHLINQSDYLREKSIPFVYLTTAGNAQLVREAYEATVQGFYKKASDYAGMRHQIKLIIDYWQTCLHPNREI
jgi:CheY-like chemotaxis protein